ncbi:MarR family winged helix-turn-helix transcriptional regulator [uncultured Clostridium sp.]|uniref:MarR family winged helix-turn-helix transcriptional regulator n=1 Tax=uncultured Clostridium sp. TaxID=59620 RepID=UPI0025E5516C|nr:MarR family winged helix-turn-helix transcriptional regulator [uncultured Clostridium sp.]
MQDYPGKLISILYRKSQIYWAQVLKEYDITCAEYPVLIVLQKKDGITQEYISSVLNIDKSAITRVIQSLLGKGFIEKKKDDEDKRCNRIYLTEKGQASKGSIDKERKEWNTILTKNISQEKLYEVLEILSQMADNISE